MNTWRKCPYCDGSGEQEYFHGEPETCCACQGSGEVTNDDLAFIRAMDREVERDMDRRIAKMKTEHTAQSVSDAGRNKTETA